MKYHHSCKPLVESSSFGYPIQTEDPRLIPLMIPEKIERLLAISMMRRKSAYHPRIALGWVTSRQMAKQRPNLFSDSIRSIRRKHRDLLQKRKDNKVLQDFLMR